MTHSAEEAEASIEMTIGFDATGDPLLLVDANLPRGVNIPPDAAEGMALYILQNVYSARAYAKVARKMMLDGTPAQQVVHFLRDVMMS